MFLPLLVFPKDTKIDSLTILTGRKELEKAEGIYLGLAFCPDPTVPTEKPAEPPESVTVGIGYRLVGTVVPYRTVRSTWYGNGM